jgi:hypothetical protein
MPGSAVHLNLAQVLQAGIAQIGGRLLPETPGSQPNKKNHAPGRTASTGWPRGQKMNHPVDEAVREGHSFSGSCGRARPRMTRALLISIDQIGFPFTANGFDPGKNCGFSP